MPLIANKDYKPPPWLFNGHIETVYPVIFRKIHLLYRPEKITINTPDGDYFDLNYYNNLSNKTVIISHGLEGNNTRPYVTGMVKIFVENGWNAIAWNYRGCNGIVNNTLKSYHSGFTEDLVEVINFADKPDTNIICLIGFSLGGNITLKYLGKTDGVADKIKSAVTFSVPMDLYRSCLEISKSENALYSKRFLITMKRKIKEKAKVFPELQIMHLSKIKNLKTFDDYYTAPLHGFKDAMDYYETCSSINVLDKIKIPTLIVNALNDPFLPAECYPVELIKNNPYVYLEIPSRGGHVGFCSTNGNGYYWSELRAFQFLSSMI